MSTDQGPTVAVPASLRLRQYAGPADVPTYVRLKNRELEADRIPSRASVGDVEAGFAHASVYYDPARDLTFAELDDRPVAFAEREWVDARDDHLREYRIGGAVLPEFRGRGIGAALLLENERRSRALAATHQTDRTRIFGSWSGEHQAGAISLLRRHGYHEARWFFEMERPTLHDVVHAPVPEGLEVRRGSREVFRPVWDALVEAFMDHWGGFDESEASLERWKGNPHVDPTLWLIAWDGDQLAGGVINGINPEENEALGKQRGWLEIVFTRRPWRRRGLARALIGQSLDLLRESGATSAVLGVDADNATGALGLYESAGFEVEARSIAWRKPMDEPAGPGARE